MDAASVLNIDRPNQFFTEKKTETESKGNGEKWIYVRCACRTIKSMGKFRHVGVETSCEFIRNNHRVTRIRFDFFRLFGRRNR